MKKFKQKLSFGNFIKSGLFALVFVLTIFTVVEAAPPTTPYDPGDTLAPACVPGSLNCTVVAPAISTRSINVTAPLLGGGNLSIDRNLSIPAATSFVDGYLTSADWNIFNSKQDTISVGTASQYFRGDKTWQTLDKLAVGLSNVDNVSDLNKPVSTATQTALNLKANLASATFAGNISATNLSGVNTGDETSATIKIKLGVASTTTDGYLTSADWNIFNSKQDTISVGTASQYFRGDKTWQTLDKLAVGLSNVDNVSDLNKPVSIATQSALNLKANLASATFAGNISATNLSGVNTGDETSATIKTKLGVASTTTDGYLTSADWNIFNSKQDTISVGTASQYFRGDKTWQTLDKLAVGLSNVDNVSDLNKPVSTATQSALNLKANLASATFAGNISATNLSGVNTGDETSATIKIKLGVASTTTDGYLTSADWNIFNNAQTPLWALNGSNLSPVSTSAILNLGSAGQFKVDASGNLVKINNITYSFPSVQGATNTVLTNDGSGGLTWTTVSGGGGSGGWTDNGANVVLTTDSDLVGIGTTTLTAKLTIVTSSTSDGLIVNQSGTGNIANFQNSGTSAFKVASSDPSIVATGGTITESGGYKIHTFLNGGTFQVSSGSGNVEVLVVAGGAGGGGADMGAGGAGGGGAGGVVQSSSFSISAGNYSVTVGAGGAGGVGGGGTGINGTDSSFSTLVAVGGGGGGHYGGGVGSNGGSGGGSGWVGSGGTAGTGIAGQGNNGGSGGGYQYPGGGGGGAGAVGVEDGGIGIQSSISGTTVYYAGGGGAGNEGGGRAGGNGGGGNGGGANVNGGNAFGIGSGGGGAGGYWSWGSRNGGNGGSGIVIIRYPITVNSLVLVNTDTTGTALTINKQGSTGKIVDFRNSTASAFSILNNGNTGIGTITPNQKLEVAGRVRITNWVADGDIVVYKNASGDLGMSSSDIRLKKNIVPLKDALAKISKLQGFTYNPISESDTAKKQLGLSAQDVMAVLPEVVYSFNDSQKKEYYGLRYEKLSVLLVEGVKEQQEQIEELKEQLALLSIDSPAGDSKKIEGVLKFNLANRVKEILNNFGFILEQGMVKIQKLATISIETEKLKVGSPQKTSGMVIFDRKTKQPHCVYIEDGKIKNEKGECNQEKNLAPQIKSQPLSQTKSQPKVQLKQPAQLKTQPKVQPKPKIEIKN